MKKTRKLAALLLALTVPGMAVAQPSTLPNPYGPVAFTNVDGPRSMGGLTSKESFHITSQQGLVNAGIEHLVSPGDVDWDTEMLLAVFMGAQRSGGYSIQITGIERKPLFTAYDSTPGLVAPPGPGFPMPPSFQLVVKYEESSPSGPAISVITTPYHLVKLNKERAIVRFEKVRYPGQTRNFRLVALDVRSPAMGGNNRNIQISDDGSVQVRVTNGSVAPPNGTRTFDGTVTATEMRRLEDFVKLAQMGSVDDPIPGPAGSFTPHRTFVLTVKSNDPRHMGQTRGRLSSLGGTYEPRLRPLLDLTQEIANRIQTGTTPSNRNFTLVQLATSRSGFAGISKRTVSIQDDGSVEVRNANRLTDTGPTRRHRGTATDAEMSDLEDAVKLAQMASVPDPLDSMPPTPGGATFLLTVKSDDARHEGQTRGRRNPLAPAGADLANLLDLVDRIGNRVLQNPSTGTFTAARLISNRNSGLNPAINPNPGPSPALRPRPFPGPGSMPITQTVEVQADGSVEVKQSHPLIRFKALSGTATPAELSALEDAIKGAELASVPDPLDVLIPMYLAADPFSVKVASDDTALRGGTSGHRNFLGQYSSRLRPLIDALEDIAKRIRDEANPQPKIETITGEIDVRGWYGFRSVHLVDGAKSYEVKPWTFAKDLVKFEGEKAMVRGKIAEATTNRFILTGEEIISPTREMVRGHVSVLDSGKVTIEVSSPMPWLPARPAPGDPAMSIFPPRRPRPFPLTPAECFGPAAHVLKKAGEAFGTVDGWVFRSGPFGADKVYVEAVKGKAEKGAVLRRRGHSPKALAEGTEFMITRLSRSKKSARVELNGGTEGWVKVEDVNFGPRRLHGDPGFPPMPRPVPMTGNATGLAGNAALGGN